MPGGENGDALFSLVGAIAAGIALVAVAHRLNFSAIAFLLLGGIALGPVGFGIVKPASLEHLLPSIVSLSVGLILFEGGLTLDPQGYRKASGVIVRLLSVGVVTTWLATAVLLWLVLQLPPSLAILAASLVIVTGPTVINPLLKRIKIQSTVHNILHWEAVLVDPIGVFVAILCFEWLIATGGEAALIGFASRVISGLAFGLAGGVALRWLFRRQMIGEDLIDTVPVGAAVLVFGLSEAVAPESGLLATTVAGLVLGASGAPELKRIRRFKAGITDLLIGVLFILLAARLQPEQFVEFGWRGIILLAFVMLGVRPLTVAVSSLGQSLTRQQRLFISWVAPRGIVAASMASLFALRLDARGVAEARLVETFVYSVIVATILLQGLTAGWLARRLQLVRTRPSGWLIIGANLFARQIADFIRTVAQVPVILLDSNARAVHEAKAAGFHALQADGREAVALAEQLEFDGVGNVLCLTDNEDLNTLLCHRWSEVVNSRHSVYCWHSKGGGAAVDETLRDAVVWSSLPKPSLLSADLERHRASLAAKPVADLAGESPGSVLLLAGPGRVRFDVRGKLAGTSELTHVLTVRRWASPLVDAIHPALFMVRDHADYDDVLREMIDKMVEVVPKLPAQVLYAELSERERLMPSSIGHGVTIPHAYSRAVSRHICAIARLSDGLSLKSLDDLPSRLVFLVIGPPGDPEHHLALMADIARLVAIDEARERLLAASSFDDILRTVQRCTADPAS